MTKDDLATIRAGAIRECDTLAEVFEEVPGYEVTLVMVCAILRSLPDTVDPDATMRLATSARNAPWEEQVATVLDAAERKMRAAREKS